MPAPKITFTKQDHMKTATKEQTRTSSAPRVVFPSPVSKSDTASGSQASGPKQGVLPTAGLIQAGVQAATEIATKGAGLKAAMDVVAPSTGTRLVPAQTAQFLTTLSPSKRIELDRAVTSAQVGQQAQRAIELNARLQQLKMQDMEPSAGPASTYLTGGSSTGTGTPYAAGLQQPHRSSETEAQIRAVTAELQQARKDVENQNFGQRWARLVDLAKMDRLPTAAERAEIQDGIKYLEQHTAPLAAEHMNAHGEVTPENLKGTQLELETALLRALRSKEPSAFTTAVAAASTAIPGAGVAMNAIDSAQENLSRQQGAVNEWAFLPEGFKPLAAAKEAHPVAYGVSKGAGDVGMMLATAGLVKAIPAVAGLGKTAQGVIGSGAAMGVRSANDAATEGAPAKEVLRQGAIGAAGGAVGGAASSAANALGTKALFGLGFQNNIVPNVINQGLAGTAFSGGNIATRAALDKNYDPSTEEILSELGVAFAFSSISSAIGMSRTTKAAKANLEMELEAAKRDYAKIVMDQASGGTPKLDALDALAQRTAALRNTLSTTQYVGYSEDVNAALEFLNQLDDAITTARTSIYGTMLPGEMGTAAAGVAGAGAGTPVAPAGGILPTAGASAAPTLPSAGAMGGVMPTATATDGSAGITMPTAERPGGASNIQGQIETDPTAVSTLPTVEQKKAAMETNPGDRPSVRSLAGEMPREGYRVPYIAMPQELLTSEDGTKMPEGKIPSAIRKYMIKLFRGKVLNVGPNHKVYISKDGVEEFAFPVRRMDNETKLAKMAAGVHLDATLEPSTFLLNTPDDGRHPKATGGWDNFYTMFETDTGLYSGIVKTMVTDRGREFYDITEIQKEGGPTTRGDNGLTPPPARTETSPSGQPDPSMDNILPAAQNVNPAAMTMPRADQSIGSLPTAQPQKLSLDDFLAQRGLLSPVSDYNLDKIRIPHGETSRQRAKRIAEGEQAAADYSARRNAAITEYNELVASGKIAPKSTIERLLETAHGHEDNQSVQAARRTLQKRGINWETGQPLSATENTTGAATLPTARDDILPTAVSKSDTLPTAQEHLGPKDATLDPLDVDQDSEEYWSSLYRTREAPLEPLSDEWMDDLVMNGERDYVPQSQTAEEIAVSQGLEPDMTPKKAQPTTAEEVEANKFIQTMDTLTRKVLKDYQSKAEPQEIIQGLQSIFERMGGREGLRKEQIEQEARALAKKVLGQVEMKNDMAYQDSREARDLIRSSTIHVPPEVSGDIPDFADFRKRHFGGMKLSSSSGREIDDLFSELAHYDAGYFDGAQIPNRADQLLKIAQYLDDTRPQMENPYEAVMDEASDYLAQEMIDALNQMDSRRQALRAAASVREAADAFYASMGPDPRGPAEAAKVLNELPRASEPKRERAREFKHTLYRALVDSGETVDRIGKGAGDKSLYSYYNFARASGSAAQNMLARGGYQSDIWGRKVGDSLGDIFSPIREKGEEYYQDFQMYLLHMHNIDRMSRYNPAAIDIAQADFDAFQSQHPEISHLSQVEIQGWADQGDFFAQTYLKLQQELSRVQHTLNKPVFGEAVDAEFSRGEADRLIREHPEFGELAKKVYQYSNNLLQYQVDSGLMTPEDVAQIQAMYPHYVPVYRLVDGDAKAVKSQGIKISKVLGLATGGNADIVPLHVAMSRQTMRVVRNGSANRFASRLLDDYDADKLSGDGRHARDHIFKVQETASTIHPDTFDMLDDPTPKMENAFTVYQDGKSYTVTADKGLLEAMSVLTGGKSSTMDLDIWKPFQAMNSLFKSLVTGYNPMFSARNFARDLQEAGLYSKDQIAWAKAYPRAVLEIATNGELWRRYQALGGVWSSVFDYNQGYTEAKKEHGRLQRLTIDKVDALNLGVEQAPRLAEFIAQLEKNGDTPEGVMDAMHAAANVTTNFGRSGKVGAFLNKTFVPFLNPGIQGLDKLIRTFLGKKTGKEWLRLIAVVSALGFAPMVINEVLNHDAPNWDDIRDSDKDVNWLIHVGEGKYLKIPKGRDISVIGMGADRLADVLRGEKVDVGGTLATAVNQIAPSNPLKTNLASPLFDSDIFDPKSPGKTWYGGDIESQRLQGYAPGQRYDEKTDAISKAIGGTFNVSPKKINYILDQYTGVIGDFTLPLLTPAGDKNILAPFTKAFVLDAATNNRISGDFYDTIDQLEYAENGGDGSKAVTAKFMSKQSKAASDLYKQIREVENSDLPNKEKVEKVRDLKIAVAGIQKNALEVLPAYEEAVKKHYTGSRDDQIAVTYRKANREVFGAEYALKMEGKSVYEKAAKVKATGVSYEDFYTAYEAVEAAKQRSATGKLSDVRKWRAVMDAGLKEDATKRALSGFMSDTQYKKLDVSYRCGVSPKVYITFQEAMAREEKNNQATVERVLDGIMMSEEARAVLWQISDVGRSPGNNPYNRPVSRKVLEMYKGYSE